MKKQKKLTSVILALILAFACICSDVSADEKDKKNDNKVEILFSVGDSTLSINGNDVTVETPYVKNETTLVPLRVITEAFGADVNWNDETKTVTINYCGVEIKLIIGNAIAYINGNEIELLVAPELTNNTTMLPMRFITENFGADVSYDEITKGITVVKEITETNSIVDYSMLLKSSTKDFVGDSYYNWSVERSPRYKLAYRSFDGRNNRFEIENIGAYYDILIYDKNDLTIDKVYTTHKEQSNSVTTNILTKSKTANGIEYVNFQYKSADHYCDFRTYIYKDYIFDVVLKVDAKTDKSEFLELAELSKSFDFKFDESVTEDLSDIDSNGMHTYKSKEMGIEISIPADYFVLKSDNQMNEVRFIKYGDNQNIYEASSIILTMYSSYKGHTYKTWAETDHKNNKNLLNSQLSKFSEVKETTVADKAAVYYSSEINAKDFKQSEKDVFISAGNYFYNIAVSAEPSELPALQEKIYSSVVFSDLDEKELGTIMRTDDSKPPYDEHTYEGITFEIPSNWQTDSNSDSFFGAYSAATIYVSKIPNSSTGDANLADVADGISDNLKDNDKIIDVSDLERTKIGAKPAYEFNNTTKLDNTNLISSSYNCIIAGSNAYYVISITTYEIFYGAEFKELIADILSSIKLK